MFHIYLLAFLIGVIAGLRAMTAPAVVSWATRLGWLHVENTWLVFLGSAAAPYVIFYRLSHWRVDHRQVSLKRLQLEKAPPGFIARIVTGGLSERISGATSASWVVGLAAGVMEQRWSGLLRRLRISPRGW